VVTTIILRKAFLIYGLLSVVAGSLWAQKLVKQKLDPTITISVPEDFKLLTNEAAQARSLAEHAPLGVYIDPTGDADIVVNTSKAFFDPKDVAMMKAFYQANVRALFSKVTFLRADEEKVSGKPGLVFEFVGEVAEKGRPTLKKYYLTHYGLRKRRVVVATFSCEAKAQNKWAPTAAAALKTLKITEK